MSPARRNRPRRRPGPHRRTPLGTVAAITAGVMAWDLTGSWLAARYGAWVNPVWMASAVATASAALIGRRLRRPNLLTQTSTLAVHLMAEQELQGSWLATRLHEVRRTDPQFGRAANELELAVRRFKWLDDATAMMVAFADDFAEGCKPIDGRTRTRHAGRAPAPSQTPGVVWQRPARPPAGPVQYITDDTIRPDATDIELARLLDEENNQP